MKQLPQLLAFVALIQGVAILLTKQLVTPPPGSASNGVLQTVGMLAGLTAVTLFLVFAAKRSEKLFSSLTASMFGFVFFSLQVFYISSYSSDLLIIVAGSIAATAGMLQLRKSASWGKHLISVVLSIETGVLLLNLFSKWGFVVLIASLAAYDLFSVYAGPLKYLIRTASDNRSAGQKTLGPLDFLMTPFGDHRLGLGDTIFYAGIAGFFTLYSGVLFGALSVLTTLTGLAITIYVLDRTRTATPALPLPVILSLLLLFI